MASIKFDFINRIGRRLAGVLETGEASPRAWAVFAPCFTCGKASLAAVRISRSLASHGIGTLRIDFSGLGESEGEFGQGLSADAQDVVDAAAAMAAQGMNVSLLVGHSFGGAAVIAAAEDLPQVKALATIGAPARAEHVLRDVPPDLGELAPDGRRDVIIEGRTFAMGSGFVRDIERQDQMHRVATLGRPLMVLHSPVDQTVGVENASEIFLHARHPKSFVSLDHADHLLTRAADAEYVAGVIAAWSSRYLTPAQPVESEPAGPPLIRVEETGAGLYQVRVSGPGWVFLADEPVAVGGLGSGPAPHDLVSAGLGACTAITCRMYATRKGWPLAHTTVEVTHKAHTATEKDHFDRAIRFEGDLDEEQRARLFDIADRCPVHRTLTEGATVTTTALEDVETV
ncbi:MAG TPA: bifunctional alpha/beta hydrolase/OsmC family protein [Caulobacteraceae bacterium]|jgi:putative redox protein|nr:bifunctional alpha/beta hydrolase/OsmC family protein [Caulobacteraceae bacterium]